MMIKEWTTDLFSVSVTYRGFRTPPSHQTGKERQIAFSGDFQVIGFILKTEVQNQPILNYR